MESRQDEEEEEYLVYLDFGHHLTSLEIEDPNLDIKIIGIDSKNPVTEINGKTFKGNYEYALGTNVFFERNPNPPPLDPLYKKDSDGCYKFLGKTNKVLSMNRIFLETETGSSNNEKTKEETLDELKSRLEVNASYADALNLLLPPGAKPPRIIESTETIESKKGIDYDFVEGCDDEDNDPDYDPSQDVT